MEFQGKKLPTIEGYQLIESIGSGGVGAVYSAIDLENDERVAIKVLDPLKIGRSSDDSQNSSSGSQQTEASMSAQRFFQELIAVTRIKHQNVVQVFDFGISEDDELYIVMELLEGSDMSKWIKKNGPLPFKQTLNLFLEALEPLAIAHQQQLVHQDLKPSNLFLVNKAGQLSLIVTDFGIAKRIKRNHIDESLMGSLPYMAPEYLKQRVVSPAGDVYQLGMTLIELITGQRVIQRRGAVQIMYQHLLGDFDYAPALKLGRAGQVIAQAISVDVTQRFQHAGELIAALHSLSKQDLDELEYNLQYPEQAQERFNTLKQGANQESTSIPEVSKKQTENSSVSQKQIKLESAADHAVEIQHLQARFEQAEAQLLQQKKQSQQHKLILLLIIALLVLCLSIFFFLK